MILGIGRLDFPREFPCFQSALRFQALQRAQESHRTPGVLHCVCDGLAGVCTVFVGDGIGDAVAVQDLLDAGLGVVLHAGVGACDLFRNLPAVLPGIHRAGGDHRDADRHPRQHAPQPGPLPLQHVHHPVPGVPLAEGQGRPGDDLPPGGKAQQR